MERGRCNASALDEYCEAVARLQLAGQHVAYLATQVEPMRAGWLFRRQERVWLLVTHLDGRRDPIQEDYAPWSYVGELQEGHLEWAGPHGGADYTVEWLSGEARQLAWAEYGIHEEPGAYMGPQE